MAIEVYFVDTDTGIQELQNYVEELKPEYVSLDLETNSVVEKKADIYGIGLCFKDEEAFYIPIRNNKEELLWSKDKLQDIYRWVAHVCKAHKLIGWNLIYDVLVFENNSGIDISQSIYSDGILLKHTVDEERPFGLKENAVKFLGEWADKAQTAMIENIKANGGRTTKEHMDMWKCDVDVLGEYCGWDTVLSYKLFLILDKRVHDEGLADLFYKEEIMPLYKEVTIDMKRKGFHVDVEYFKNLHVRITNEIYSFEDSIQKDISELTKEFVKSLLNEKVPVKAGGDFPKLLANHCSIPLPYNKKTGAITLAKKDILNICEEEPKHIDFYNWILGTSPCPIDQQSIQTVQTIIYFDRAANEDKRHVFNLKSDNHLRWLFFTKLGMKPLRKTETGEPSIDADTLDELSGQNPFADKIIDFKKLCKLKSTYIEGILERQIDGVIYTSLLQFGTTSGRYSSRDPNLQNIPRVKDDEAELSPIVLEYTNAIKRGFIAPPGYKIVNADYSALEPVCFAHVSNEERLRDVFRRGHDLYSTIAIDVWNLTDCSADKKAPNYLKKKYPEKRQLAKIFCLAVVYGAEAGRISGVMGISYQEAEEIIRAYLEAYPELKNYMRRCDMLAANKGIARTDFGRIRHLPVAKALHSRWGDKLLNRRFVKENGLGEIRYKYKNALNNGKNFPIQGLAAHIVNRAALEAKRKFKSNNLDSYIAMQTHDELTCISKIEQAEITSALLQDAMVATTTISVPLSTDPIIADNWADAK